MNTEQLYKTVHVYVVHPLSIQFSFRGSLEGGLELISADIGW